MQKVTTKISNINRIITISRLPRSGFANCLLVWFHGKVFSEINSADFSSFFWLKVHIGPFIRAEKSKRLYMFYPKKKEIVKSVYHYLLYQFKRSYVFPYYLSNYPVHFAGMVIFKDFPKSTDYFSYVRHYQPYLRDEYFKYFNIKFDKLTLPHEFCAVHIRRGDFKFLGQGPLYSCSYFDKVIGDFRESFPKVSIYLFSDSTDGELNELISKHQLTPISFGRDIEDFTAMVMANYLIITPNSTFSLCSAFLSTSPVFYNCTYIEIRNDANLYEGSVNDYVNNFLCRN